MRNEQYKTGCVSVEKRFWLLAVKNRLLTATTKSAGQRSLWDVFLSVFYAMADSILRNTTTLDSVVLYHANAKITSIYEHTDKIQTENSVRVVGEVQNKKEKVGFELVGILAILYGIMLVFAILLMLLDCGELLDLQFFVVLCIHCTVCSFKEWATVTVEAVLLCGRKMPVRTNAR